MFEISFTNSVYASFSRGLILAFVLNFCKNISLKKSSSATTFQKQPLAKLIFVFINFSTFNKTPNFI
jgi:hypothetical protein